ncbi:MAG: cysteine desulfurase family protein [Myxococcota bacterium]
MRIHLDHNATTPVCPEAVSAMTRVLREEFGNPSSVALEGARARSLVEAAREDVAALLGAAPDHVRFTSGATEANNTLLFGLLGPGDHVVTTQIEHPSVSVALDVLAGRGILVDRVAPDATGCVPLEAMEAAIRPETRLVCVIWANNETGAIQPIPAIAERCRAQGIWLHADATQAIGKVPVGLAATPVDSIASSAHKLGGPKGIGALVARDQKAIRPLLVGGGQERGLRGGTENVAGIVGYGAACRAVAAEGPLRGERMRALRDRLWQGLVERIGAVRWNGAPETTLPNTLNVELEGLSGEALLQALDLEGIAVSAGAACHSGSVEPSKILLAMGRTPAQAQASLRFSVGPGVDAEQIDRVLERLEALVPRLRRLGAA